MWLGAEVVGAGEAVDGLGISTTHILGSSQWVSLDRRKGKDGSTCGPS